MRQNERSLPPSRGTHSYGPRGVDSVPNSQRDMPRREDRESIDRDYPVGGAYVSRSGGIGSHEMSGGRMTSHDIAN